MKTSNELAAWMESNRNGARAVIERFQSRLDSEDPAYAFEWMGGAMEAAAEIRVANVVLDVIAYGLDREKSDTEVWNAVKKMAMRRVMNVAENPNKESGWCGGEMNQMELKVWAKLVREMEEEEME